MAAVNKKNEQGENREGDEEAPSLQLQNPREGLGASYAERLIRVKILPNVN